MDTIDTTDTTQPAAGQPGCDAPEPEFETGRLAGERELADYLDDLIAATLAQKTAEKTGGFAPREAADTLPLPASAPERDEPAPLSTSELMREPACAPGPDDGPQPDAPQPDTLPRDTGRGASRVSMRDQLLALFNNPERLALPPTIAPFLSEYTVTAAPGAPGVPGVVARTPRLASGPVSTGLEEVDARLGGGFGAGVHLVTGRPGAGKTAFLESVGWEAVSSRCPVLYYAFREGSRGARASLAATLSALLGLPPLDRHALRQGTAAADEPARVDSLDGVLRTSVLPWLEIVDAISGGSAEFEAFLADAGARSREAKKRHGELPLILIDDLESLARLTRVEPRARLLARLDEWLVGEALTGLIAMAIPPRSAPGVGGLPVQTTLLLAPARASVPAERAAPLPASRQAAIDHIDLIIVAGATDGRTETLPLLLDRRSGLLVEGVELGNR
jgi:hypothetical protein